MWIYKAEKLGNFGFSRNRNILKTITQGFVKVFNNSPVLLHLAFTLTICSIDSA